MRQGRQGTLRHVVGAVARHSAQLLALDAARALPFSGTQCRTSRSGPPFCMRAAGRSAPRLASISKSSRSCSATRMTCHLRFPPRDLEIWPSASAESVDRLCEVANEMETRDGVSWVCGVGTDGVMAFIVHRLRHRKSRRGHQTPQRAEIQRQPFAPAASTPCGSRRPRRMLTYQLTVAKLPLARMSRTSRLRTRHSTRD